MSIETVERDFQAKVCERVRLEPEGVNRYRVLTPFLFEDGDHLAVVLKREQDRWVLSDEGHTFMHLTYDIDERDLQRGNRAKIIANTLAAFSVDDRAGELILTVPGDRYGDALYSFVQALLKIADVTYLAREQVRSTFLEDLRDFLTARVPEQRRQFEWHHPQHDPDAKYVVQCRVNGSERPLFIFALPNDDWVRDATIGLLQFERWNLRFRALGIFEEQEAINRKVLARFTDVCGQQFSSLAPNHVRIERYLEEALGQ